MSLYIGLDIGTTAVKALVVDERGRVLAEAQRQYGYATPKPGWVEQDAEDWWRLACECVREVVGLVSASRGAAGPRGNMAASHGAAGPSGNITTGAAGPRGFEIKAIAVSTQGDTVVPLDAAGVPLAPAITWMDKRTDAQVARMEQDGDLWFRITGSAPAAFAAATSIMWWREAMPEVLSVARRFALVADFIIERLVGQPLLDSPNASRTMLFDITRRQWAPELLARAGIEEGQLAPVAEAGTVAGTLRPEVAADLGLSPRTQVVLGGHDQTCGAVGCGVIKPGSLLLSCGTAWVVLATTAGPVFDETHSLQGYCHATKGGYAVLGAFAGGNLLRWFRDECWGGGTADGNGVLTPTPLPPLAAQAPGEGEQRLTASSPRDWAQPLASLPRCAPERENNGNGVLPRPSGPPLPKGRGTADGDGVYDAIAAEAQRAQGLGRPRLVFLPHFYGASAPLRCPSAKGAWAGLTLQHTRGDLALALLEGVALQAAATVETLARQGAASDDIRMIGGGARSRFWAQLVADATGVAIHRPQVREAAAYGAALIAATAAGAFSSLEEATAGLAMGDVIEPAAHALRAQLPRHRALLEALAPVWEALDRLEGE